MTANDSGSERYERKFRLPADQAVEAECLIRINNAAFHEIYQPRYVNNLYFDDSDLSCYRANLNGDTHRVKFRTRWYGTLYGRIEQPIFEMKIKEGLLGRKQTNPLPALEFASNADAPLAAPALDSIQQTCPAYCAWNLSPVLLNRYARRYYLSADRSIRMTLDSGIRFYSVGRLGIGSMRWASDQDDCILELKSRPEDEERARAVAQDFPFRLSKFSKYVEGIERLMV